MKNFKNEIRIAKNSYIRDNLIKNGSNSKKIWDVLNNFVIGKNKTEKMH